MLPIEKFPEVPEGLEREVYDLYESTAKGKAGNEFSAYFLSRAEKLKLSGKRASELDSLVDRIYGTYETIKMVLSDGRHKPRTLVEFNVFQTAAYGTYNATGLFYSGVDGETFKAFGDYDVLMAFNNELSSAINSFINKFFNSDFDVVLPSDRDTAAAFSSMRKDALAALKQTLRFEAAVYKGMKAHYGITVEIPS